MELIVIDINEYFQPCAIENIPSILHIYNMSNRNLHMEKLLV